MRLIRGTPVHRIDLRARINHANRSDWPYCGNARRNANSRPRHSGS